MTGLEMVYNFQELLETTSPVFKNMEKLELWRAAEWIDRAQMRYIKEKFLSGNTFVDNVFRISLGSDDVAMLIESKPLTSFTDSTEYDYGHEVEVPDDFMVYIRMDVAVDRTLPTHFLNQYVPAKPVNFNKISSYLTTPFNSPVLEEPVVTMKDSKLAESPALLLIIDDYTTVRGMNLTYVKKPSKIELSDTYVSDLAEYLHEGIVELAVSMYLEEYKLKLSGGKQNA